MNRAAGFIAFKALGFSGLRVQGKLCITVKNSNTALFSGGLLSSIIVVDSTDKPCSFSCVGRAASNRALGIASSLDQVYGFSGLGSSGVCVHVFAPLNQKHSAPTNFPRISMPCASSLQFWGVQLCGMRLHKMFLCVCVSVSVGRGVGAMQDLHAALQTVGLMGLDSTKDNQATIPTPPHY